MIECKFDIGDKLRQINSGDTYTIIAIHDMTELKASSYYTVLSTHLTTHRLKFITANKNFEKVDHSYTLGDEMQWVRE